MMMCRRSGAKKSSMGIAKTEIRSKPKTAKGSFIFVLVYKQKMGCGSYCCRLIILVVVDSF